MVATVGHSSPQPPSCLCQRWRGGCASLCRLSCSGCSRIWINPSWMKSSWSTSWRCRRRRSTTRWRSFELWTNRPRAPWRLRWWRGSWRWWSWRPWRWGEAAPKLEAAGTNPVFAKKSSFSWKVLIYLFIYFFLNRVFWSAVICFCAAGRVGAGRSGVSVPAAAAGTGCLHPAAAAAAGHRREGGKRKRSRFLV